MEHYLKEKDNTGQTGRILTSIFVLLLMLGVLGIPLNSALAEALPSLYVTPSSYAASYLGENVAIKVYVFIVFDLTAFRFQLRFNTTLLQCLNASMGNFFFSQISASTVTVDNGQGIVSIQAQLQSNETSVSGGGSLLVVYFNATYAVQYPQPNAYTLAIVDDELYGIGNQPIQHDVENGTYIAPYVPPQLGLTLNTDSNSYHFEDKINVSGVFAGNGYPVPNTLVALEIEAPNGDLVAARTFDTSNPPVLSGPLQITGLAPCDSGDNLQDSFEVGNIVYFTVTVKNAHPTDMSGLVIVNPYDSSNASLGVATFGTTVPAGGSASAILSLPLQYSADPHALTPAASGIATVYASVWTGLLENGGIPISLESEATFNINGTAGGSGVFTNPPPQGTYQTCLSVHYTRGTYSATHLSGFTMYVEAAYMGNSVVQSKQILITIAGDINMDGQVNPQDLMILANAYGSKVGAPVWNPAADINGDGNVNLEDLVLLALNFGKGTV